MIVETDPVTNWVRDDVKGWLNPNAVGANIPSPTQYQLPAAATDAGTTQTLANALRTVLIQLGLAK